VNVEPFRVAIEMLSAIPGVGDLSATVIVSEIGIDMSRFETAAHLISWAGLCRRTTKARKAPLQPHEERRALAQVDTDSMRMVRQSNQRQLSTGPVPAPAFSPRSEEAVCAVAASILTAIYHMLKNGTLYQDLGTSYFDNRAKDKQALRLIDRLKNLGFEVQIKPLAA